MVFVDEPAHIQTNTGDAGCRCSECVGSHTPCQLVCRDPWDEPIDVLTSTDTIQGKRCCPGSRTSRC